MIKGRVMQYMKTMVWCGVCILMLVTIIVGCSSVDTFIKGNELSYVKEKLEPGMAKAEVKKLFGRSYTNVYHAADNKEVWRFDSLIDEGYVVVPEAGKEKVDRYDRAGFLAGKLSAQLFIVWSTDNDVKNATVYYMADGKIHEYNIPDNGQTDQGN